MEAERMKHAALPSDEAVLDPELVIPCARRNLAVIWIVLAPAPLGMHRTGLDARNHAHVALRRSRKDGGDLLTHRIAALRDCRARVVARVLVIQRRERLEI